MAPALPAAAVLQVIRLALRCRAICGRLPWLLLLKVKLWLCRRAALLLKGFGCCALLACRADAEIGARLHLTTGHLASCCSLHA